MRSTVKRINVIFNILVIPVILVLVAGIDLVCYYWLNRLWTLDIPSGYTEANKTLITCVLVGMAIIASIITIITVIKNISFVVKSFRR